MGRHASRSSSGPIPGSVLRAGVGQSPGILALRFKLLRLLALARARLLAGWRAVVVQPVIHTHTHIHTGLVHGGAGWMDGWMSWQLTGSRGQPTTVAESELMPWV